MNIYTDLQGRTHFLYTDTSGSSWEDWSSYVKLPADYYTNRAPYV